MRLRLRNLRLRLSTIVLISVGVAIAGTFATVLTDGFGPDLAADETVAANAGGATPTAPIAASSASSASGAPSAASSSTDPSLAPIPAQHEDSGVTLAKAGASEASAGASSDEDSAAADMIAELRRRREAADAREKALDARETELKSRELAVETELKKLQSIRDDIDRTAESRKKENDDRVAKIVETVETMSPKAAAPLLAAMDEPLAVAAMGKIATPKLAKIMNLMEPRKSARLSELLAGVVRARGAEGERSPARTASNGAAEATTKSAKGGE